MNRTKLIFLASGICLLSLLSGCYVSQKNAAALENSGSTSLDAGGQALEIGPTILSFNANPGQTISSKIILRNISSSTRIVTNEINDFTASGEDGTPRILLEDDPSNPYSIKKWIDPVSSLTLKSKEVTELTIKINVPSDASPGGYYGVIRFTGNAPDLDDTGVALSGSLGTLMILTVNGDVKENLNVEEYSVNNEGKTGNFFEATPVNFVVRLKNTGNIHEEPYIRVAVKDMFGKAVAGVKLNSPPEKVLPNSIRRYDEDFGKSVLGDKILFGRYTAEVTITYGKDDKTMKQTISFWVIPYRMIGAIIAVLIIGFIVLRFSLKRYNRHIISKSRYY